MSVSAAVSGPENKDSDGTLAGTDLETAMKEAEKAVERSQDLELSADLPEDRPKTAQDAVTEAMITAKNELEEVLEQTKKEAANMREKWMRAAADLENFRKRAQKEREDVQRYGNEKLLKDFLPVIDDLERAVDVVGQTESAQEAKEQLLQGMTLVHKKFLGQLQKSGVESFDALGEPFDPSKHEAVQQLHDEMEAGRVCQQLQRGFQINERLLRPALVVVSLGPEGDA